ncbi:ParB N-terminal domain-containing protein [Streptomyces sp. NPDC052721]|uniref:ParB N-terminal domain-containing protein n=1 Tax=Streptomyces sp. NPDC052721 TaxID=3154955 RepID=UPI003429C299
MRSVGARLQLVQSASGNSSPAGAVDVGLQEIRFGGSPRFREEDVEHTRALAEIAAEILPPIIVHRSSMTVVDGLHRSRAALLRGERTIRARFFDGTPEEAFLLSVKANQAHGLPLSLSERKAAAARLLRMFPHHSDRSIAASAGLSDKTVARLRRASTEHPQLNTRTGVDGRGRPVDGADRRRLAARLLTLEPHRSLRDIAGEVGISPATVLDVRRRIARGEDPVPAGPARAGGPSGVPCHRAPARRDPAHDPQTLLRTLRRDPALRSSEAGRELLRRLHAHLLGPEQCAALLRQAPPHCRERIADLAEVYAEGWHALSESLRDRSRGSWPETETKGRES